MCGTASAPARSPPASRSTTPTGAAWPCSSAEGPGLRARPGAGGPQPLTRVVSPVGPPGAPWHFLYFFPDPQGHNALRPTPANSSSVATAVELTSAAPGSPPGSEGAV